MGDKIERPKALDDNAEGTFAIPPSTPSEASILYAAKCFENARWAVQVEAEKAELKAQLAYADTCSLQLEQRIRLGLRWHEMKCPETACVQTKKGCDGARRLRGEDSDDEKQ